MRKINLALQGGGAHGAFTWGVLDRLLEDDTLEIVGISGTSAGALNGAALKAGMVSGGRQGARDNLDWVWSQVSQIDDGLFAQWVPGFGPSDVSRAIEYSLPYQFVETASRVMSPYFAGPLYKNPLAEIVDGFSFDLVCADVGPDLFICATNVRSGKVRVFSGDEVSTDAILASACLPTLFQAVEIDGEAYWDGGYTGNPALFPLFAQTLPEDIVIVNINPLERSEIPRTPQEIQNRLNEISFNSSLLRELRAIEFVQRLLAQGAIAEGAMKDVRVHMIADDALMNDLSVATKIMPTKSVISALRDAGRASAQRFLDGDAAHIGLRNGVDLPDMFG